MLKPDEIDRRQGRRFVAGAMLVHLLTASGAVLALLAITAIWRGAWHEALAWLLAALVVDGIDGPLARALDVAHRTPRIDGAALDLVVDYLTYVLVPALLIWRAGFLPPGLALPLCAAILVSSLYVFARRDMKTEDGFFRGFPALWNGVAFYFVLARPAPELAALAVAVLVAMTFAPIHVVHPFRTRRARPLAIALAVIWAGSISALLLLRSAGRSGDLLMGISLCALAGLTMLGLARTWRGGRPG